MTKPTSFARLGSIPFDIGKLPPQAIEIEEAILGAILIDPGIYSKVAHLIREPAVFYKDAHQKIIQAVQRVYDARIGIDLLSVCNELKKEKLLEIIGGMSYLTHLMESISSSEHTEYHCMLITDPFLKRELIRISFEMQQRAYNDKEDATEIAEWAEEELVKRFDLDIEGRTTFKDALHSTMLDIANKAKGIVSSFVRTGDPEIDSKLSFRERQICLIAGAEGSGKTKFMSYIAKGMLDYNENIRILWFSMEDSKEQIVRSFISMGSELTTKQMQSINYVLSEDDMVKINTAKDQFGEYIIEFVDRVCSISTIMRRSRNFRDKYKTGTLVIIVDNLGLISTDAFYKGLEKDDYLAGKLKETCDETEACMFILHHITKDSARKFNIQEGYRPRKEHIKGSTRILDYVQQAILVNLPRKYKDLVLEEKLKSQLFNVSDATGKFNKQRFKDEFWKINPKGDKNTKNMTDLFTATWDELKLCTVAEKMDDGSDIGVGFLMRKYIEYSIFIEEKNRGRETQYHTEKLSIYSFINSKKYLEDFRPKPSSRTFYLYGEDMSLARYINELFIAEGIKNRDGSDVDDQNIIRYRANLDYNIFKPLEDGKNERILF